MHSETSDKMVTISCVIPVVKSNFYNLGIKSVNITILELESI